MGMLLLLIMILSIYGMLHTYVVYPWWTKRQASRSTDHHPLPDSEQSPLPEKAGPAEVPTKHYPPVALLMAVHNEETVLPQKLDASLAQDYPGRLTLYIGCDNCSDQSLPILEDYARRYPARLVVSENPRRLGKPETINRLFRELPDRPSDLLLWMSDASVMPAPDCLRRLVEPMLQDEQLALCDAQQLHEGIGAAGISRSEDTYIRSEARLKVAESRVYDHLIGPFGGCYLLRADYFRAVPPNFLVDDFYLCMAAYEAGGRGISVPDAYAYEGVGQELRGEFRRKQRIATGNWQNFFRFRHLWWPPTSNLGYAFFSHKVLRWWTPLLGLLALACLLALGYGYGNYWARAAFISIVVLMSLPSLIDVLLQAVGIHWLPLRNWRYFVAMNLALLLGFFTYLKGVRSNVWQPSQRH